MKVIKGFATHSAFTNNTPNQTHIIGELSQYSRTFAKDVGFYINEKVDNITLNTYTVQNDGVDFKLDDTMKNAVMTIITAIYTRSLTAGGQVYGDELENLLLQQFANLGMGFKSGPIVNDGRYWIPAWMEWRFPNEDSIIKIWFSDPSFQIQFDEFIITVVPPLDKLDDFFKHPTTVKQLLASRDYSKGLSIIQAAKQGKPESILRAEMFNYINPQNMTEKTPTNWTVLIYGPAGNNIDSIKDALVDYVLKNSTHTRDEWIKILPDLFKRTEFLITPQYTEYAIENLEVQAGINSPIANVKKAVQWMKDNAWNYPPAHVENYCDVFTHPYKSLSITSVGSVENRDNLFSLRQVFPDFISVNTMSQDFDRMSEPTRNWAEKLSEMLILADTANRYTTLPGTYTKVQRNGKWYIVYSYQNIHYLVSMKSNFEVK